MTDRHARFRRADVDRRRRPTEGFRASSTNRFERLVADAVAALPGELRSHLDDVHVTIEDVPPPPSPGTPDEVLLARYQVMPRNGGRPALGAFPDRLVLYRRPLEARSRDRAELAELLRATLVHELADHLGLDDDRLDELGWG
jgi:predicted Zn-dependent protease with MMP-like domain